MINKYIVLELKDYDERLKELIEYYISANKINRNEREKNNNINKLKERKINYIMIY